MLGEAFLHVLNYTNETPEHTHTSEQNTHSYTASPPETTITHLTSRSPLTPRTLRVRPEGREKPGPRLTSAPSTALTIPSFGVEDHWGSWNCPSICEAYPDLQLAGDTLRGPRHLHNLQTQLVTRSPGPLLQSQDLGSLEALRGPGQEVGQEGELQTVGDEGYLVIQSIRAPDPEPRLTDSMLNGFLEKQLMEVYSQHMQDSLARCASSSLTASVCVPALVPAHLSVSDGLDSSSSHSSVQYLSTCSAPPTSHFSSPVLRISYPQEPN